MREIARKRRRISGARDAKHAKLLADLYHAKQSGDTTRVWAARVALMEAQWPR